MDPAGYDLGQQRFLHRRGAEARDRYAAEDWRDHEDLSQRGTGAFRDKRLDDERHFQHTQPGAAVLGRYGDAAQAGFADGGPDFMREFLCAILAAPIFEAEAGA